MCVDSRAKSELYLVGAKNLNSNKFRAKCEKEIREKFEYFF